MSPLVRIAWAAMAMLLVGLARTTSGQPARSPAKGVEASAAYEAAPHQLRPATVVSRDGMVVAATEQAARAGAKVLEAGGNAVDAAVAAALVLGVTEPMSSGLGGQTFILLYRADGTAVAIDGSCRVPGRVQPAKLKAAREKAERGYIQGHRAVAVPGTLAALAHALERFGTRRLEELLAPAIEIADAGYRLNTTAAAEIRVVAPWLLFQEYVASMFLKDLGGTAWGPDHLYCASDLADTMRRIARLGPEVFYRGEIAGEIEADMLRHGGFVRRGDLATLRAVERQPLRGTYRGLEVVCFPAPGGGGNLLAMLNILERFPRELLRGDSLDRLHLLIEAARIVKTDAETAAAPLELLDRYLADRDRAAARAATIRFDRALRQDEITRSSPAPSRALGTTQISVADRHGNLVSLAQTIGAFFGSDVATPGLGFLYNGNLNAFDFTNTMSPRFPAPGRVPLTTMTPAIILRQGRPLLVLGSAGSDRIVPSMVAVISAIADRGLGLGDAVGSPRALWGESWGDPRPWVELAGEITPARADALEARGFAELFRLGFPAEWFELAIFGGTNAIAIDRDGGSFIGVADPRRQGVAAAPSGSP